MCRTTRQAQLYQYFKNVGAKEVLEKPLCASNSAEADVLDLSDLLQFLLHILPMILAVHCTPIAAKLENCFSFTTQHYCLIIILIAAVLLHILQGTVLQANNAFGSLISASTEECGNSGSSD